MPTGTRSSTAISPRRASPLEAAAPPRSLAWLWRRRWAIGLFAALAAGILLRLIWLGDAEYKADEAWTVAAVRAFWQTHVLRPVGIPSSAGVPHPGLSLWFFLAIGAFLPRIGPLELTRAVQIVNVAALVLLAVFVQRSIERPQREPWLWATALVAVNPLAVLFSRKLWAQDTLPLFSLALLAGWWQRGTLWGAFLWGLAGALIGQIHLTGFLFAAAFFAVVVLFDRRSVRWPAWATGTALGILPLIPWMLYARRYTESEQPLELANPLLPFGDWVNFSLGIDLYKPLGEDFLPFLRFPDMAGRPRWLAALAMAAVIAVFAVLVWRVLRRLHIERRSTLTVFFAGRDSTRLALIAAFFGYCPLLFLTLHPVYQHYMIVAFPLPALWLAWIAEHGTASGTGSRATTRRLLAVLVGAQAALTLMFLVFVHQTQTIRGDYGTAYRSQLHPK